MIGASWWTLVLFRNRRVAEGRWLRRDLGGHIAGGLAQRRSQILDGSAPGSGKSSIGHGLAFLLGGEGAGAKGAAHVLVT